ncbi:MAG: VCBS repeat-containing protein, partial [Desulfobulbaceae bacterium]|nr:VCBS repeat-containing protein [Desulfobulbaceae bacterium]
MTSIFVALLTLLVLSTDPAPAWAKTAEPAKRQVVFLPFTVEIPGSYAYLRNGLASMLASRLASRTDIAAVPQGASTEQMAKALKSGEYAAFSQQLRQSGADYLIMGSLTPKGDQFELTSYVFSNAAGQAPKKFHKDVVVIDNAMTAVDEMAWEISSAVFGKAKPEESPQTKTSAAFQTAHPERAYREGRFAGTATGLEVGGRFELTGSYRSKNIPSELMDINAGDLNGDGTDEIVLLTSNALIIYGYTDGQFKMIATVDLPNHLRYLSVTMADLNKNGFQEIYISGSNGNNPDSSALEWNGKKPTFLFQHVPYYLRAMTAPKEAPVLLGQTSLAGELNVDAISLMALDPQRGVTMGKPFPLPKGFNIFDFAQADLNGDGAKETIAINKYNKMQVFDAAGTLLWTSAEQFGATNNFFGTLTSDSVLEKETVYSRTRLVISDLDLDGTDDVLIGKNRLETVKFMPNLRYFDGSSIAALKW